MSMSYYLDKFEKKVVEDEISREVELTKRAKSEPKKPLYFPNFPGGPVIVNLWSTRERLGAALGVEKEEIVDLLAEASDSPSEPRKVKDANIDVVEDPDLRGLPIPKYYPKDGGRYITSGVVIAELDGNRNLSFHRMMLTGKDEFTIRLVPRDLHSMYEKAMEREEELDIAVCIGVDPSVLLAAATSVDYEEDELKIASAMSELGQGEKVEVTDLDNGLTVPADFEYVLQGKITKENDDEGPFVDITSTYDHVRQQPVVKIDKVLTKEEPIFHALVPGGHEHYNLMGLPRESILKREISKIADVEAVRLTEGGSSWLHGVVSINKDQGVNVEEVIEKAFQAHTSMKKVTVVDADIDIFDDKEIEWAVATRFQPDDDLMILEDKKGSSLDPSAPELTSKWGLNATKPWESEDFDKAEL